MAEAAASVNLRLETQAAAAASSLPTRPCDDMIGVVYEPDITSVMHG